MKNKTIIHVDMDAFYASVEIRDNPNLKGKPVIIGALPDQRGVVATASYEARKYGVHSAMNIKEAYRLCPKGIYLHPNMKKYKAVSNHMHRIWLDYTDVAEFLALDEAYLDVTGSLKLFGSAEKIGREIKRRIAEELNLTCSVGIGYSMASAKFASEEDKPDGFFIVRDRKHYVSLIYNRNVSVIPFVGRKTAQKLNEAGYWKVKDILKAPEKIEKMFGSVRGRAIVEMASGIDHREITPYYKREEKSIGHEETFQEDTSDFDILANYLILFSAKLAEKIKAKHLFCQTVTVKVKYSNMKQITRSCSIESTASSAAIRKTALELLDAVPQKPVRLIGLTLSGFSRTKISQVTFGQDSSRSEKEEELDDTVFALKQRFGAELLKTGSELNASLEINREMNRKEHHE